MTFPTANARPAPSLPPKAGPAWAAPLLALALMVSAGPSHAQTTTTAPVPSAGSGASQASAPSPLSAVAVDLNRYLGTWYQIALYPNMFQKQCASDTQATYRVLGEGRVEVLNRCRRTDGDMTQALGEARVVAPGQLKVRFAPGWLAWLPFVWADYWVVDLEPNYRYAIVSEPDRDYLWVLSRTPQLSAADDAAVRARLLALGFDLQRLQFEKHGKAL
jgi:apolipoprotein D and lipocalin family protein